MDDFRSLNSAKLQDSGAILKTVRQMVEKHGDDLEAALKKLNVCRGGFTYAAAQAILPSKKFWAQVKIAFGFQQAINVEEIIAILQRWQFVTMRDERYFIDPLVIEAVGEDASAKRAHYDYFYALARQHDENQDYAGLEIEIANLEAAFDWAVAHDPIDALKLATACEQFLNNREHFDHTLNWWERVVESMQTLNHPALLASAQYSLGTTLHMMPTGDQGENLRRAATALSEALRFWTAIAAPLEYANTQNNLGLVYIELARLEDKQGHPRQAVEAFTKALRVYTADTAPLDYASTQNNLGIAYRELAVVGDKAVNLRRSVEAYTEALRVLTAQGEPLDSAGTQYNLGNVYQELAAVEDQEGNLRRSVEAYTEALRVYTAETEPQYYATMKINLGIAYQELAAVEDKEGHLRRAVAAYTEALRFKTLEAAPLEYPITQYNLGLVYSDLAAVEDGEGNLRRAAAAYTEALRLWTAESEPQYYAQTQNNFGLVYQRLATVEDKAGNLRRAVEAYNEALRVYTAEATPLDYAKTQNNLGIALKDSGELRGAVACWREAGKYYRLVGVEQDADLMREWIEDVERRLGEGGE